MAREQGVGEGFSVAASIVVCTHNPIQQILSRTLAAVYEAVSSSGVECEVIIVDNNSSEAVGSLPYVRLFLDRTSRGRVVHEQEQGLTQARMRGLSESEGRFLVFFDDDNEPSPEYLREAAAAFSSSTAVGVWGPGNINVEFLTRPPHWVSWYCRQYFQERSSTAVEYACLREPWHRAYPPGSGQCVRRDVMETYCQRIRGGSCTATDRTGNSLASGGDGQIVHTAVAMGLAAGVWPGMRLRHLIPEKRCNERYLERLAYGVSASLLPATVETFPEVRNSPLMVPPSWLRFTVQSTRSAIRDRLRLPGPVCRIHDAGRVGETVGRYVASGKTVPRWLHEKQRRYE
jgi:hypothetical protein